MIAVVEQALGNIHRGDSRTLIFQAVEHELMTAQAFDRQFIDILQRLLDIIGIEYSQRSHLFNMLTTQRKDIGIGTHHHAKVAMIGRHEGEAFLQTLTNTHRTSAWTTTAMRRRERLVQVDVHHVETHIARATGTKHRVQVGTIVVHQAASLMNQLGNLRDARLEQAQRIRVGHHHGGNIGTFKRD